MPGISALRNFTRVLGMSIYASVKNSQISTVGAASSMKPTTGDNNVPDVATDIYMAIPLEQIISTGRIMKIAV